MIYPVFMAKIKLFFICSRRRDEELERLKSKWTKRWRWFIVNEPIDFGECPDPIAESKLRYSG